MAYVHFFLWVGEEEQRYQKKQQGFATTLENIIHPGPSYPHRTQVKTAAWDKGRVQHTLVHTEPLAF